LWLVLFQRKRFRRRYCAKSTRTCATIARDHKRSRPLAPAFPPIRTLRALANRVQSQIGNQCFGGKENWIRRQPHFDPRRFLRLVQGRIDFGARHDKESYKLKPVTKVKTFCSGAL